MGEKKDDFDEIVKRLDLDLSFPEERPRRDPEHPSVRNMKIPRVPPEEDNVEEPEFDDLPDEPFYRKVQPAPIRPRHRGRILAWIAVLGSPVVIMAFTLLHVWLAKPVLLGLGFTFVAGSIYLISQLPEHGPGRPEWPDDGAAL